MADEITPVTIPGAAKGTPLPVEVKADKPVKPRSTQESIRAACMANKAAAAEAEKTVDVKAEPEMKPLNPEPVRAAIKPGGKPNA